MHRWIGLNDLNGDGTFEWVDGSPFSQATRNTGGVGEKLNLMASDDTMSKLQSTGILDQAIVSFSVTVLGIPPTSFCISSRSTCFALDTR